jgi:hypothetical protein
MVSHPRRQQVRRIRRAGRRVGEGAVALGASVALAAIGLTGPALLVALVAVGLLLAGRRSWRLAARSAIGARSEAEVRHALAGLAGQGWRVVHGVEWPAGGDLDHVVRAPSGIGFVVETKTTRYGPAQLERTVIAARWLARRRRRYPRGVIAVVCLARARRVERVEHGALVVSVDRLPAALAAAAAPASRAASTWPRGTARQPPAARASGRLS